MTDITIDQMLDIVEWSGRQETCGLLAAAAIAVFTALATVAGAYGLALLYRHSRKAGASVPSALFLAAYALCVAYAGSDSNKPPDVPSARIVFDASLYDDGSVATNDHPTIRWRYDPWIAADVLHIDARPKGSTNDADWIGYHVGRVADASWTGHVPACTGMAIHVWSEYVPPSPVTTNGVYHLDYLAHPLGRAPEPEGRRTWSLLRTPVYDASERRLMSPPALPRPLAADVDVLDDGQNNEKENNDED